MPAGGRSRQDPQCPTGTPGPAAHSSGSAAGTALRVTLNPLQPRPAFPREAAPLRERRAAGLLSVWAAPGGSRHPTGPPRGPNCAAYRYAARHSSSALGQPGLALL
ncbi:hypothetical protein NDU88_000144 [Pleurodeles waltl]|uniref:Uncharacterized protein n=1 Tax=Pleurodeles waltl TaxID=8319 RepID=A0AAV7VXA0_PLEWA|nr:hypothetical protein NDU88_000144 [Pleurodeles waltl]